MDLKKTLLKNLLLRKVFFLLLACCNFSQAESCRGYGLVHKFISFFCCCRCPRRSVHDFQFSEKEYSQRYSSSINDTEDQRQSVISNIQNIKPLKKKGFISAEDIDKKLEKSLYDVLDDNDDPEKVPLINSGRPRSQTQNVNI